MNIGEKLYKSWQIQIAKKKYLLYNTQKWTLTSKFIDVLYNIGIYIKPLLDFFLNFESIKHFHYSLQMLLKPIKNF
jgi:hypothetical protein